MGQHVSPPMGTMQHASPPMGNVAVGLSGGSNPLGGSMRSGHVAVPQLGCARPVGGQLSIAHMGGGQQMALGGGMGYSTPMQGAVGPYSQPGQAASQTQAQRSRAGRRRMPQQGELMPGRRGGQGMLAVSHAGPVLPQHRALWPWTGLPPRGWAVIMRIVPQ